ncbi:MAG TPA: beta-N-acetylhexosaminidase [Acetobacteraceae bacterium]|nr:beta-N-acetylhexosaminidase [Acetobacteraceae bacterium]
MRAAIAGVAGLTLLAEEAALLRRAEPAGVILFGRNVADPAQLAALVAELRRVLPEGAVLLVDQEGGRVARLRPPHWRAHPPAAAIGARFAADPAAGLRAAWLTGALIGLDCAAAGFDVACAPVLDLAHPGAHSVIGDRAFGADPRAVARLGGALAAGLLAAGIQPVAKHAPGHGRALADSHEELPVVAASDLADDVMPFTENAGLPWMMTAHIVYAAVDPAHPATLSARVIAGMVRRRIGFDGVLVTDDLSMRALAGPPAASAVAALAAGCDLALYGAGDFARTAALLDACPAVRPETAVRLAAGAALAQSRRVALDGAALAAERARLLA